MSPQGPIIAPPRDSRGVRLFYSNPAVSVRMGVKVQGLEGDQGPEQGHLLCGDQGLWGEMKVAIDCIALRRSTPLKISSQLISCWKKKNQSCVKDLDVVRVVWSGQGSQTEQEKACTWTPNDDTPRCLSP